MHTKTATAFLYARHPVNNVKDKVVLITGAGKGCGRILATAFAERGACVAANDISPINVEDVVNDILKKGGRAKAYVEDVAKKLGAQLMVNEVEDDFGQIDILINHAAVEPHVPILDMDEWDWHRVLDVNLTGAFLMTQSVGRVMRLKGKGIIINFVAGFTRNENNQAAYIASMSGLDGFTYQLARELNPYGIRVYAVANTPDQVVEQVFTLIESAEET